MNYFDIGVIILLIFGAVSGLKKGFTRQLISAVGFIVVVIAAFLFRENVAEFLYSNLPFFKFGGYFKGVSVLNILVYETIAFFILVTLFSILLRLAMLASSIFEKFLNATIILGIPSKLAGAVVGVIQYYILAFIALYILSFPVFNPEPLKNSKYATKIIEETPILSGFIDESMQVVDEFMLLKDKYNETETNEFNLEALNVLLKYKIVTVSRVDDLVEKDKLQIDNIESVIKNYR